MWIVANIRPTYRAGIGYMNAYVTYVDGSFLELGIYCSCAQKQKEKQETNTVHHGAKIEKHAAKSVFNRQFWPNSQGITEHVDGLNSTEDRLPKDCLKSLFSVQILADMWELTHF